MFSPSTLCLCRPELFILHKEKKKCKGIQGQSKRWELSVRYTNDTHTHIHIHISGHHLLPTHARRNVYILGIHANTHARAHVCCEHGWKVQKGGALEERHRKGEEGWCFFRRKEINVRKQIDCPAQWAVREQKTKQNRDWEKGQFGRLTCKIAACCDVTTHRLAAGYTSWSAPFAVFIFSGCRTRSTSERSKDVDTCGEEKKPLF